MEIIHSHIQINTFLKLEKLFQQKYTAAPSFSALEKVKVEFNYHLFQSNKRLIKNLASFHGNMIKLLSTLAYLGKALWKTFKQASEYLFRCREMAKE